MKARWIVRTWIGLALLVVCLSPVGCSCDGDDDDSDDDDDSADDDDDISPDDCLDEGRMWLGLAEGDRAREAFECAIELDPEGVEGRYGIVLSEVLQLTDAVSIIADYAGTIRDLFGSEKAEDDFDETDVLDRFLQILIDGLAVEIGEDLADDASALQGVPDPLYEHDGIPIVIKFEVLDEMAGEFDGPLAVAAEAYGNLLSGVTSHLLVLSLDMDISLVFMVGQVDFDDTMTGIGDVVDILKLILNDPGHSGFLAMDDDGVERFRELGLTIGDGLDAFVRTWTAIATDTDAQADDVIGYVDADASGAFDPGEPYFLPVYGELDDEEMADLGVLIGIAVPFRDAFWDRTEKDVDPANPNPLPLAALNPLLERRGIPGFIPDGWTLPVGDWYAEPDPLVVRRAVTNLVVLLDALIPGSGRFE